MVGSRVYVGGLPYGVRERDLEKFFKGFGRVRDILIKNGYGFVEFEDYRDADDAVYELNGKELLGERVVVEPARGIDRGDRFRRDRDRDRDRHRGGRTRNEVSVERAKGVPRGSDRWRGSAQRRPAPPPNRRRNERDDSYSRYGPPTRTDYRLIVENLSSRISWQDLKDYMRQAGEVTYADAHKQHRNEGVVEFASHSDMRAALEKLDGTELNGRRVRLVEDKRSSRRRGGAGSRSSSRSRSRSPRRRSSRSRSRSRRSSRSRSKSRGKSPAAKSRSRSRSKDRGSSREPERRRSADRERSGTRERSRSKEGSPARDDKARSRSASRSRSRSREGSEGRGDDAPPRENGRDSNDRSPRSGD